jgi:hypothetical protein
MTGAGRLLAIVLLTAPGGVACHAQSDLLTKRDAGSGGASGAGGPGAGGIGGADAAGDAAAGAGGDAGGVLSPIVGMPLATFDTTLDGFFLDTDPYGITGNATEVNLGGYTTGLPRAALSQDATAGSPTPGCLKLSVPFAGSTSLAQVQAAVAGAQDWSGRILHARVRLASGMFFGDAELFARGGFAAYAWSTARVPSDGSWTELTLDVSNPPTPEGGFDPTAIVGFGLQLNADGTVGQVDFQIDSFSLEQAPVPPDAASD